ncbi:MULTISPECIES: hypothetical protein [unclassified Polaromonas]|uniref:hypothetical protein n=1 Tax=unclassified Polaromonas TaxID=2638319 RepID=UPI0018C959C9|nr:MULTISPECIES: hypothetical protein [unclassified Polaromonas]MBG6073665.1 hypothetical protein [Polaromonas sp. CG_9.7]MBG6115667.1 hypothetical protein [Polaromonas sp. CG_9.2]MDH6186611.1 hypothetical protein [Polaromonas sp. CG_23.6]
MRPDTTPGQGAIGAPGASWQAAFCLFAADPSTVYAPFLRRREAGRRAPRTPG